MDDDPVARAVGPVDAPDYEIWHATVDGAIRYDVGGTPAPIPGARETLNRLGRGPNAITDLRQFDPQRLEAAADVAVQRGVQRELSCSDTAHAVLDGLRAEGVPVPPRPPDDPFPEL